MKLRLLILDRPQELFLRFYEPLLERLRSQMPTVDGEMVELEWRSIRTIQPGRLALGNQPWSIVLLRHRFFSQTEEQLLHLANRQTDLHKPLPLVIYMVNAAIEAREQLESLQKYPRLVVAPKISIHDVLPLAFDYACREGLLLPKTAVAEPVGEIAS